jgi:hypothetical protein
MFSFCSPVNCRLAGDGTYREGPRGMSIVAFEEPQQRAASSAISGMYYAAYRLSQKGWNVMATKALTMTSAAYRVLVGGLLTA